MNVIIVYNPEKSQSLEKLYQIIAFLDMNHINHSEIKTHDLPKSSEIYHTPTKDAADYLDGECSLIITLGGDGTILRAARLAYLLDAPILGLNFGRLGFLANEASDSIIATLSDVLADEVSHERRSNLHLHITYDKTTQNNPLLPSDFFALNDIVIARGDRGHILDYSYRISDVFMGNYRGDGMLVASATGSSAYSLSIGGPLVHPTFSGMIVVPTSAHTLQKTTMLTAHHDVVEVTFPHDESSMHTQTLSILADGEYLPLEAPIHSLRISIGPKPTILLRSDQRTFYQQVFDVFLK